MEHHKFDESLQLKEGEVAAGRFVVDPELLLGGRVLPLDALAVQTVLTKCMGPITTWLDVLKSTASCNYTMVHFTPVQKLGESNSAYSLFDQLTVPDTAFPPKDYPDASEDDKWKQVASVVQHIESELGMLSMVDVVWNHTATNTPWLIEHPEAGYNLVNSPHLIPAYVLDSIMLAFSAEWVSRGGDPYVKSDHDIDNVVRALENRVKDEGRLWEFFVLDVRAELDKYHAYTKTARSAARRRHLSRDEKALVIAEAVNLIPIGRRKGIALPAELGYDLFASADEYQWALDKVNLPLYLKLDDDIASAMNAVRGTMRWERLDANGPKLGAINAKNPVMSSYFARLLPPTFTAPEPTPEQRLSDPALGVLVLANNGWVMSLPPTVNFASRGCSAYLRREIIIWSDSCKLNYGASREENPWLWDHMKRYSLLMATIFHAFRIDNCHSTPRHVARYLLDAARTLRPELYVTAELFANSRDEDERYASELGITSLIREAIQARDIQDLTGQVRYYAGRVVAGLQPTSPRIRLGPHVPRALFFDCTHDNEVPAQKRTSVDTLPNAAVVAMAHCAIGSTRGYDLVLATRLDVVKETRLYNAGETGGIMLAKAALNKLHRELCEQGYEEIHLHVEGNIAMITRQHPRTKESVLMAIHTAFFATEDAQTNATLHFEGTMNEILFEASLEVDSSRPYARSYRIVTGVATKLLFQEGSSSMARFAPGRVELTNFPPGSIVAFRTRPSTDAAVQSAIRVLTEHHIGRHKAHADVRSGLEEAVQPLTQLDINVLLYRSQAEESASLGDGVYHTSAGPMVYAGLQGWASVLEHARASNDMGNALCNNLREGNWGMDYCVSRLEKYMGRYPFHAALGPIATWMRERFELVKKLPRYLVPQYFHAIVMHVLTAAEDRSIELMSEFVQRASPFIKQLALTSVQLVGHCPDATLVEHAPPPSATTAAGLPFFANGYMRTWGRDSFIALRGLLLVTGRYEEARAQILGFAVVLRHGLIPNLLASGSTPRYNARDATWWWLQAVQDYVSIVPDGEEILKAELLRKFTTDSQEEHSRPGDHRRKCLLVEVIEEILSKHANGIHFREWNAGHSIDSHMKPEGFDICIRFERETGFIYGGSRHNCGTWMDKMGESVRAGIMGVPSTPRDGADVEIIGLLKSALRWICDLIEDGTWPSKRKGVQIGGEELTYQEWNRRIQASFENKFFIPGSPADDPSHAVDPARVRRRNIYKDTLGASNGYGDYQLRPNFPIAMAVAPELFVVEHARAALDVVERTLVGPLGMRTLDPEEPEYRPNYNNATDSDDPMTSKGSNYHQGPEWVWPLGYYLRARSVFCEAKTTTPLREVTSHTVNHRKALVASEWRGLVELTNKDGAPCPESCATQAWSSSTLLDAYFDACQGALRLMVVPSFAVGALVTPEVDEEQVEEALEGDE